MKKKTTPRTMRTKTDRQIFSKLYFGLLKLGFYEMSVDWKIKNGCIPPNTKRIPEVYDEIILKKRINGYDVVIVTSFNPTIKEYMGKKVNGMFAKSGGSFWIHVNDPKIFKISERAILTRVRYKKSVDVFLKEISCIVYGLNKKPMHYRLRSKMILFDPSASRCSPSAKSFKDWFKKRRSKIFEPMWVSDNFSAKSYELFREHLPEDKAKFFRKLNTKRRYYRKVVRKNKGIKKSQTANVIRKPYIFIDELK